VTEQDKEQPAADAPSPEGPRKTRELFRYLITTFQSMLPPDKAAQFGALSGQLEAAVEESCAACMANRQVAPNLAHDPRRSRFLLRLVVGKVSPLFSGPRPKMPRSLIEGLDRYLKRAFGQMIYDELNAEADTLLFHMNCDDDHEMWRLIRENNDWSRFVDTVFIRILFRFENFASGKMKFVTILDTTMREASSFNFTDEHFYMVFEALFTGLYDQLEIEDQRLRWDFHFGDGTCRRISGILDQGLVNMLRRRKSKPAHRK